MIGVHVPIPIGKDYPVELLKLESSMFGTHGMTLPYCIKCFLTLHSKCGYWFEVNKGSTVTYWLLFLTSKVEFAGLSLLDPQAGVKPHSSAAHDTIYIHMMCNDFPSRFKESNKVSEPMFMKIKEFLPGSGSVFLSRPDMT